jgi:hypothetical protein
MNLLRLHDKFALASPVRSKAKRVSVLSDFSDDPNMNRTVWAKNEIPGILVCQSKGERVVNFSKSALRRVLFSFVLTICHLETEFVLGFCDSPYEHHNQ